MKSYKHIKISINGETINTDRVPLPEDGSDPICPVCGCDQWNDVYDIIQYGFDFEDHLCIMQCDNCGSTNHTQYSIKDS